MRAVLCVAALAAAAALPAHAECGAGLVGMISPSGGGACVGAQSSHKLLERGWLNAPYSVSVQDTLTIASTADALLPSDSAVARVLEGRDLHEDLERLVRERYEAAKDRDNSLTEVEMEWLQENPVIRVAYERHWPPLEYERDGGIGGLTALYIGEFEEFLGAEFVPVGSASLTDELHMIESGDADMAFMVVDTGKEREYMYFTEFHTALAANMITYGGREMSVDDLPTSRVGTVRGGEIEEWLDSRHRDIDYVSFHSYPEAFGGLRDGRIDVLVDSWIVAQHVASAERFKGLRNSGSAGHISEISIGCSKDDAVLCRILAKALESIPDEQRERMLIEAIGGSDEVAAAVHEAYMATKQRVGHLIAEEREWLAGRDSISVIYEPNWAPLEFVLPDGSLGGLTGMYAEAFSEFAGIEFVPQPTNAWIEGVGKIGTGEADVSIMIAETDERLKRIGFTEPHTVLAYSMITYGEDELGPGDIGDVRLGTIRGYGIEDWLDLHHPDVEYVSIDTHIRAFEALEEGRIDALVEVWPVVAHIAEDAGFDGLHSAGTIGHTMNLAVGYTKTEPVLGDIVTKALEAIPDSIREEMLVEAILAPYLSSPGRAALPE